MSLAKIQNNIEFVSSSRFMVCNLQLRITGIEHRRSQKNSPYSAIKLADCTAEAVGIVWWDRQQWSTLNYHVGDIVNVAGEFIEGKYGFVLNINSIQVVDPSRIEPESLLPSTWMPRAARPYAETFCQVFKQVQDRYLREFVIEALMSPAVALGYCSGQGSMAFHHNWPGGLLQHSVEVAAEVLGATGKFSTSERDVGVVLSLLHDIGKAVTTAGSSRTELGRHQPHDMSGLEVLSEALARLDRVNAVAANKVRSFFKPAKWYPHKNIDVVRFVREIDGKIPANSGR